MYSSHINIIHYNNIKIWDNYLLCPAIHLSFFVWWTRRTHENLSESQVSRILNRVSKWSVSEECIADHNETIQLCGDVHALYWGLRKIPKALLDANNFSPELVMKRGEWLFPEQIFPNNYDYKKHSKLVGNRENLQDILAIVSLPTQELDTLQKILKKWNTRVIASQAEWCE